MTAFYKIVSNGFIDGFGTNGNDTVTAITEEEYDSLIAMFAERPTAPSDYAYVMQDTPREWVLVELPPDDPEMDDSEAFEFLFGGAE